MARLGEGEADATNSISLFRLHQLLVGFQVEGPEGVCQLTYLDKLDGEASINNRKGKRFFFYEWRLRAVWLGKCFPTCQRRTTWKTWMWVNDLLIPSPVC
uniref:Activator of Hsp90 ATPase AHSA1-like N-terminal domain-containing protein n=1 Tax=Echeneis naucrates TaxID=173247 RepID=A0A665X5Q4_ECHNA